MAEDEDRLRDLFDAEVRRKSQELEELMAYGVDAGFRPRTSLSRTPPQGFSTPAESLLESVGEGERASKRQITSPEEEQERKRRNDERRVGSRLPTTAPPVAGILTSHAPTTRPAATRPATPVAVAPAVTAPDSVVPDDSATGLAGMTKIQMLDSVNSSLRHIVEVSGVMATGNKYKLNANEREAISQASQSVLAVVAALELRLAESEHQVSAAKLKCAQLELRLASTANAATPGSHMFVAPASQAPSYASLLKRPQGQPAVTIPTNQGHSVLFYPNTESIKTSEGTKAELQKAIKPGSMGIPVQSVRRIGNSGIAVRAATPAAAEKLKAAVPPTLKASEPKARRPLVAIRGLRTDPTAESFLEELQATNLADEPEWTLDKVKANCRVAFKKGGRGGQRTTVVLECLPALRDKLIGLGRVYVGWDEADVCDYLRITCCLKCQQYGHPEKFCRATEMVCGRCGETGHKKAECQATAECCATCKRFKRKEANSHITNAATCPARMHAEQLAVNMTQYG